MLSRGIEHQPLDILLKHAESFSHTCTDFQDPKTLGLHNRHGVLRSGNFIGVVRIGECILLVYDSGEKL